MTTCAPAPGALPMTTPLAMELLGSVATDPTTRFCPVINDRASASELPATSGTATVGTAGPLDTTRPTAAPDDTCAPAPGLLPMTTPLATELLGCVLTDPTTSFCPVINAWAFANDCPTTSGTATVVTAGPLETTRPTAAPGATSAPRAGLLPITTPLAAAFGCVVTCPTASPRWPNRLRAAVSDRPTTCGTATCATPVDITKSTADPRGNGVPGGGSLAMSVPVAIFGSDRRSTCPTRRPRASSRATASA